MHFVDYGSIETSNERHRIAESAPPPMPSYIAMNWARRLKRAFGIDIEGCTCCGERLRILASIEEPVLITRILVHLQRAAPEPNQLELPLGARAPPSQPRLM